MFSTKFKKFDAFLLKIQFLKNPRWRLSCETIIAMKGNQLIQICLHVKIDILGATIWETMTERGGGGVGGGGGGAVWAPYPRALLGWWVISKITRYQRLPKIIVIFTSQ